MNIIIATIKSWNIEAAKELKTRFREKHSITIVGNKQELTIELVNDLAPDYIFFPHWSYLIPSEIFENYKCVVFHMTDLPFGRGGSPLQNLIVRGISETKISAIEVEKELDAGAVYMKVPLALTGSAEEIFKKMAGIIFHEMIPYIVEHQPVPVEQSGDITAFKRRKPKDSELQTHMSQTQIYDYIRMLDAEGYPKAYIPFGDYRLVFDSADMQNGTVQARVTFELVEENHE